MALKRLGITYIITGPYGYDAQPIEYFFSYFKQVQINPGNQRTGKRYAD